MRFANSIVLLPTQVGLEVLMSIDFVAARLDKLEVVEYTENRKT